MRPHCGSSWRRIHRAPTNSSAGEKGSRASPIRSILFSDMLFEGTLTQGKEIPLVDVLLDAGADLDFQRSREDGKKGDTPLIGAASLGAEDVGLRFVSRRSEAGPAWPVRRDRAPLGRVAWRRSTCGRVDQRV